MRQIPRFAGDVGLPLSYKSPERDRTAGKASAPAPTIKAGGETLIMTLPITATLAAFIGLAAPLGAARTAQAPSTSTHPIPLSVDSTLKALLSSPTARAVVLKVAPDLATRRLADCRDLTLRQALEGRRGGIAAAKLQSIQDQLSVADARAKTQAAARRR